jgi:hypothetical protein
MLNTRHLMHKRPLPVRSYGRQVARRLRSDPLADFRDEPCRRWPWWATWLLTVTVTVAAGLATGAALAHTLTNHP